VAAQGAIPLLAAGQRGITIGALKPGAGADFGGGKAIVTLDPLGTDGSEPQEARTRRRVGSMRCMSPLFVATGLQIAQ
jgi:hypothetical protein